MIRLCRATAVATLLVLAQGVAQGAALADTFKLDGNQRIVCGRSLSAGKISTATCRTFAYVLNTRTSEYFRCSASLVMIRDAKQVREVKTEGNCVKKPRVFTEDSEYSFDAAETSPPDTSSFFGSGGYSLWVSDVKQPRIKGCITIDTGLGSEISKCMDMTLD